MKLWQRSMLFLAGLFLVCIGVSYLRSGMFAYLNDKGQLMFAPGAIATGVLIMALAFLPASDWVYRRISTKKAKLHFNNRSTRRKPSKR